MLSRAKGGQGPMLRQFFLVEPRRLSPVFFLRLLFLALATSNFATFGRLGCTTLLGWLNNRLDEFAEPRQAIRDIAASITKPLAREQQITTVCHPAFVALEKTIAYSHGQRRVGRDMPAERRFGIDLVDVLPARSLAPGVGELQFSERDFDFFVHH